MGSVLGRDPSSVQVSWKSIKHFLCNPAYKPTDQQRKDKDMDESIYFFSYK